VREHLRTGSIPASDAVSCLILSVVCNPDCLEFPTPSTCH